MASHTMFMQQAIFLAEQNVHQGGGPFGAVIVKDNQVIGTGTNIVTTTNDPTAHAEIIAIREACRHLQSFSLEECCIYSSCEPCPMCLSALYWSRISKLYYGATRKDAGMAGFRDDLLYQELGLPSHERSMPTMQIQHEEVLQPFRLWQEAEDKILY